MCGKCYNKHSCPYQCMYTSMHTPTYVHAHKHTHTCHHTPHMFTQRSHLWVAFHFNDYTTNDLECFKSTFLFQAQMQNLVLLSSVISPVESCLITAVNDIVMKKVKNNSTGVHVINELLPKFIEDSHWGGYSRWGGYLGRSWKK